MSVTVIDYELMNRARVGLYTAGDALDAVATGAPTGGDFGAAEAVVGVIMAAQLEAGSILAGEAGWLAAAIGLCQRDAELTDAGQAVSYYRLEET
ncbi:hypothetical protein [Nocardioides sp. AE5]|uniref:hypothetical protein n=1 Tax=Nocardioides sp. AE5 TaxID=2962573 RepID=UPI002882B686|nr:hypothetical protein [Nocardioides sp. AE5]MDT0202988.1 hypothetical protein [Nocardioides sp. AE5]